MSYKQVSFLIFLGILICSTVGLSFSTEETMSPWVYPRDEPDPKTTEYWTVPLHGGYNKINLTLWNHDKNYDFTDGRFVVAIKSGLDTFTVNVNLDFETEDLSGTTTPGQFPPGGIFPCPWKQYRVGVDLTKWQSENGWQGPGDPSGIEIVVEVNIPYPNSALNIKLYFLAWGYRQGNYVDTPYSHKTETMAVPPFVISVTPYGAFAVFATMTVGLTIFWIGKKKLPNYLKLKLAK